MKPEFLTPKQRETIRLEYELQAYELNDIANGFDIGTKSLYTVRINGSIIHDEKFSVDLDEALGSIEQFGCDLDCCVIGNNPDFFTKYNPKDVIGSMLPESPIRRARTREELSRAYTDTRMTLLMLKKGILTTEGYLRQAENFLTRIQGRYRSASERSFKIANDVQWSTNPRFSE